ncbi:MAG: hypothetical protein WD014_00140 [Dongiaceae bacterium]
MAELTIKDLDASVVEALARRAQARGTSFDEEIRRTLAESVVLGRETFAHHTAACRAASRANGERPASDSATFIRHWRDLWG